MEEVQKSDKSIKNTLIKISLVTLFFILAVALILVSVAYWKEKHKQLTPVDIQALQQQEVNTVLEEVGRHMILPEGVKPTVATIMDVDNLRKEMPFFNRAENGFKVIVYDDKAILFDPARQIIVDVAPVMQQPIARENTQSQTSEMSEKEKSHPRKEAEDDAGEE